MTLLLQAVDIGAYYYQHDIHGLRLDGALTPLDPAPFPVSRQKTAELGPAVAGDGSGYLAVWSDHERPIGWDLRATRLDGAGRVLDDPPLTLAASDDYESAPSAVALGGNWLVAWEQRSTETEADLYFGRVAPDGRILDPGGRPLLVDPENQNLPSLTTDGNVALVVWLDNRPPGRWSTWAARIDALGTVLDPGGLLLGTSDRPALPVAVFDGTDFIVVWGAGAISGELDLIGARVTPAGVVLDPGGRALLTAPGDQFPAVLASRAGTSVLVWHDAASGAYRRAGRRRASGGRAGRIGTGLVWLDGGGVAASDTASGQRAHALAFTAGGLAVITAGDRLELVRLRDDLTPIDASPIRLLTASEGVCSPILFPFFPGNPAAAPGPAGLLDG